nr:SH3 domain-containing YSC84-like protein 1 isoform X3 [Marmota flaviventris]
MPKCITLLQEKYECFAGSKDSFPGPLDRPVCLSILWHASCTRDKMCRGAFTLPVNNPIPSNLKSEAKKAAKILREFTEITSRNGPDKIIPAHVIAKAKGLAILSVIKAGFLVTARGGSGIVLARLPDGTWSAPSAIGIAGLGGGFEIGIEVSDLVIILNYDRAVEAFAKGGNLTLGGNCTVAVGPLGRNLEGNVALRSSAAVFTYCKSRGLFAGISLEGSCLIERKETNRKFYCQDIRACDILFGDVPRPAQAEDLYEILDSFTQKYESEAQRANARRAARELHKVTEMNINCILSFPAIMRQLAVQISQ